jgi:hypothetical protein
MTGANTDPITTPDWQVASALLIRIARELFNQWTRSGQRDGLAYKSWQLLHVLAHQFVSEGSISLSASVAEGLTVALHGAFEGGYYPAEFSFPVQLDIWTTTSPVAMAIRELETILARWECAHA